MLQPLRPFLLDTEWMVCTFLRHYDLPSKTGTFISNNKSTVVDRVSSVTPLHCGVVFFKCYNL